MPFKIIHIHNDIKFIDETVIFEHPEFINEVIILGEKGKYKGKYKETATYLKSSRSDINWLIKHCNDADMAVLYNLCFIKTFIANRLADRVKIAWRFFGNELYRFNIDEQQSDLTKAMVKTDQYRLTDKLKQLKNRVPVLRSLRNLFKFKVIYNDEFAKVLKRVDFFLWHYREEYDYLRNRWPDLPQFINLPTLNLPTLNTYRKNNDSDERQNTIILGNSKNFINNHFDVLNILLSLRNINNYTVKIPFSYGQETTYSIKLREKIKSYKNIILLEDFLPLDDYALMFKKASALVINTFRQKALGNVLLALQNGVKVYLNKKNIIYSILMSQGLLVYSIDQLYNDIENNSICLSLEKIKHNSDMIHKLGEDNSIEFFQKKIHDILDEK